MPFVIPNQLENITKYNNAFRETFMVTNIFFHSYVKCIISLLEPNEIFACIVNEISNIDNVIKSFRKLRYQNLIDIEPQRKIRLLKTSTQTHSEIFVVIPCWDIED